MGNFAYRIKIFEKLFIFFSNGKKIEELSEVNEKNEIKFETFEEEDEYLNKIKDNKDNYSFELKSNDKWIKEDLNLVSPSIYRRTTYRIRKNIDTTVSTKLVDSNYKYYIPIDNIIIYNEFKYLESKIRKQFLTDLELVFSSKLNCKYAAYCGHSDSGKTTSVLKFKNDVRKIYPILYINVYTIFNKNISISEIKTILKEEIENMNQALNNNKLYNDCLDLLNKKFINNVQINEKFFLDFLQNLVNIFKESTNNIINIILDQYSSKYDNNNNLFFEVNDL